MDEDDAAALVQTFRERGWTLATAESLTGGLVAARLTDVPGASRVFAGGVVAYSDAAKTGLLGVPRATLSADGAVSVACACAMARGARARLDASVGLATTGVAGPDPWAGAAPGVVFLAFADAAGESAVELRVTGDREAVRRAATDAALRLALDRARGA